MRQKKLPIQPSLTTIYIVWSRPLCDSCVTMTRPSLNRSISVVGLYKRDVQRYTIIACAAAASSIHGTVVLVRTSTVLYVVCLAHVPHTTCKRKAGGLKVRGRSSITCSIFLVIINF